MVLYGQYCGDGILQDPNGTGIIQRAFASHRTQRPVIQLRATHDDDHDDGRSDDDHDDGRSDDDHDDGRPTTTTTTAAPTTTTTTAPRRRPRRRRPRRRPRRRQATTTTTQPDDDHDDGSPDDDHDDGRLRPRRRLPRRPRPRRRYDHDDCRYDYDNTARVRDGSDRRLRLRRAGSRWHVSLICSLHVMAAAITDNMSAVYQSDQSAEKGW